MSSFAGIDSGSWTTKAVVIDAQARVLGSSVVRSGADLAAAAERAYAAALAGCGVARRDVSAMWATGFGRQSVSFADGSRTELDCHGRGAAFYVSGPLVVLDIGGQDAKVIRLDGLGRRLAHRMNRKCAAGTGSFLDEIALRLGIEVQELDRLASGATEELELSSFCTVFAGTELLGLIRAGKKPADLARAAYQSLARRVLAMDVFQERIVATGGVVAHHPTLVRLLSEQLHAPIVIPPHPQEMGAFGAALAARDGTDSVGPDGDDRNALAAAKLGGPDAG